MKSRTSEVGSLYKLAAPVALAHVAGMAMQLVDTAFVGRLGAEAIGGVSIGNAVYATFMVLGIGVLLGVDYLISHAFGAGRLRECHSILVQSLYLAVFASLPAIALMYGASYFLGMLGIEPAVAVQAGIYLKWLSFSLLPFLLFSAFRQYLQAMGVAGPILVILLIANIVNAFFNWVFVFGNLGFPKMGVAGSGFATCLARTYSVVAIALYVLLRDRKQSLGLAKVSLKISYKRLGQLIRLGMPAGIQLLLEVGVFALATMLAGRLGAVPLAAHQIALHLASIAFMIPLGLSAAAAVRVGQALGQGHQHRAVRVGWTALGMSVVVMSVSGLTFYVAAEPLMRLFTIDEAVISTGASLMLIAAFFQLFDGIQVVGTGVLRGWGDTRSPVIANLVGHWLFGLPAGTLLCFWAAWGVRGLWIGLSTGLISVALMLLWVWSRRVARYRR